MQGRPGTSLSEYGIILTLLAILCIGALALLGNNLAGSLNSVSNGLLGMASGSGGAGSGSTAGLNSGNNDTLQPGPNGWGNVLADPAADEQRVCLNSGYCMNISTSKTPETVGSNGNDLTLAHVAPLEQLLAQLKADGDPIQPDATLGALLQQLVDEGKNLADTQKNFQYTCQNGPFGYFPTTQCTSSFAGSVPGFGDVYGNRDLWEAADATKTGRTRFNDTFSQLQTYLQDKPTALPPDVQSLIRYQAGQIERVAARYDPPETQLGISRVRAVTLDFSDIPAQSLERLCSLEQVSCR